MSADTYIHFHRAAPEGAPLLFLFHGTGGDETQFVPFASRLLPVAGIVSPRGDVSEHGAARFFRRKAEGVYDMEDLARATARMAGFVRAHVDQAKPGAVIGLGYSNGANILASMIFAEPDLFDAAILMHPLIPFEPEIAAPIATRILMTAGENDPICPPEMTEKLFSVLTGAGANAEIVWHEGGHDLRQEEIMAVRHFVEPYAVDEQGQ